MITARRKNRALSALFGALLAFSGAIGAARGANLLPNGLQQFTDGNGAPYAGGTVTFYIPGTTTPKTTWSDSALSSPNTNPVVLDANGRAAIWGAGAYREILKDVNGNQIWDQVTNSWPDPQSIIQLATLSIVGNIITASPTTGIQPSGVSAYVTGLTISALAPNTTSSGCATLNYNALGAKSIYIDAPSGPVCTAGAEIVSGNQYFFVYDSTLALGVGGWHLKANNVGRSCTIVQKSGLATSAGADTSEDTLATGAIAAGAWGANGFLEFEFEFDATNNGNSKTVKMYYGAVGSGTGGTSIFSLNIASNATFSIYGHGWNTNATNSQKWRMNGGGIAGWAQQGIANSSTDTTANSSFTVTGTKGTAGDTLTLTSYIFKMCSDGA